MAGGGASAIGGPGCRVSVGGVHALVEGAVSADFPPLQHSTPHWAPRCVRTEGTRSPGWQRKTYSFSGTGHTNNYGYVALAARSSPDLDSMEGVSIRMSATNEHAAVAPDRPVTDHHGNPPLLCGIRRDGDMHLHVIAPTTPRASLPLTPSASLSLALRV